MMWLDLTVADADRLATFYEHVLGWQRQGLDMGGYEDYVMNLGNESVAGLCHARGDNADIPGVWMPYFTVENFDAALDALRENEGRVVGAIRGQTPRRVCIVADPAGTHFALAEQDTLTP
jgi:uncharacterized protein